LLLLRTVLQPKRFLQRAIDGKGLRRQLPHMAGWRRRRGERVGFVAQADHGKGYASEFGRILKEFVELWLIVRKELDIALRSNPP
jgi:hypothetical protein